MLLAAVVAVGCAGSAPPATVAIDAEGVCLAAGRWLEESKHLAEQGFMGRAADLAERADRSCSSDQSRLQLALSWAELGLDDLAIEAYQRYALRAEQRATARAERAIATLRARPVARKVGAPAERARAWQLYLGAQESGKSPERALQELERSYAIWPHPLTIVQQGLAHRRAGRELLARASYARSLALAEATRGQRARPVRIRQTTDVVAAAVHPAGRRLATATRNGGVELWDFERLEVARVFAHQGASKLVFSPTGRQLATASARGRRGLLRIWDTATGILSYQLELVSPMTDIIFSADDSLLAVATTDQRVRLYRAATGELDSERRFARGADRLALSPSNSRLAVAGGRFLQVLALDKQSAARVFAIHGAPITALAFDAAGSSIASGAADGTVRLTVADNGTEIASHTIHRAPILAVGVRRSSQHLVSLATDGTSQLWSLTPQGESHRVSFARASGAGGAKLGQVLCIDPALRRAITMQGRAIVQWSIDNGRALHTLNGRASALRALAVDSRGRFIVAGSDDGTIRRWDLQTGRSLLLEGHTAAVHALAFSADGAWLASGGADSTLRVWEMRTGREYQSFDERRGPVVSVAFDVNARIVVGRFRGASSSPGGEPGATLAWHIASSRSVSIPAELKLPPAGPVLRASGGEVEARVAADGAITLRRAGTKLAELYAARDGSWLVTAADGRIDGSPGAQAFVYWQAGDVQLPGFVGWQRQHREALLGELFPGRAAGRSR